MRIMLREYGLVTTCCVGFAPSCPWWWRCCATTVMVSFPIPSSITKKRQERRGDEEGMREGQGRGKRGSGRIGTKEG